MWLQEILAKTPCEVHTFDPTLPAQKREQVERIPGLVFHNYGLAAEDGVETIGIVKSLQSILKVHVLPVSRKHKCVTENMECAQ